MSFPETVKNPLAFIVTAAGSSKRMGGTIKKEFFKFGTKSVLEITVSSFIDAGIFDFGLITCPPGMEKQTEELLHPISDRLKELKSPLLICAGGKERQESVRIGLERLAELFPSLSENGRVLIHDGARPWITTELIKRVAESCTEKSGSAPVVAAVDAMKQISDDGKITAHLPRPRTLGVQTPQAFPFGKILNAHRLAASDANHYIDDTEIFSMYEGAVYTVDGDPANKKITYTDDLNAFIKKEV